jgi:ubiquinone/menaquinone biosynthesis C-methylase UbiE
MPSYEDVLRWVNPGHEYHQHRYARGLAEVIVSGCRWLDIGAGTRLHQGWLGPSCEELAARATLLVGCDLVPEHIATNESLTAAAVADAGNLPFRPNSFDVVTANMVLEHLENPRLVFQEIARVLAPGGRFLFVTPNKRDPLVAIASVVLSRRGRKVMAALADPREAEHIFPTYYRANTARAIGLLLKNTGLRVRHIDPFCSYPLLRWWPLTIIEAFWIKLINRDPLRFLGTNLFGELEKT